MLQKYFFATVQISMQRIDLAKHRGMKRFKKMSFLYCSISIIFYIQFILFQGPKFVDQFDEAVEKSLQCTCAKLNKHWASEATPKTVDVLKNLRVLVKFILRRIF